MIFTSDFCKHEYGHYHRRHLNVSYSVTLTAQYHHIINWNRRMLWLSFSLYFFFDMGQWMIAKSEFWKASEFNVRLEASILFQLLMLTSEMWFLKKRKKAQDTGRYGSLILRNTYIRILAHTILLHIYNFNNKKKRAEQIFSGTEDRHSVFCTVLTQKQICTDARKDVMIVLTLDCLILEQNGHL